MQNENIVENISALLEGNCMEVRILNVKEKGTVSGYFDDYQKLSQVIAKYDGAYNIFFTMNPLKEKLDTKEQLNCLRTKVRKTTCDSEIEVRWWILIDLDPIRPPGVSSTDSELEEAKKLAQKIKLDLTSHGFPEPVMAMSGNGIHLLYPIEWENTSANSNLLKRFLRYLDKKFSNNAVKVDKSTYNASRITKLYGTIACKGKNTEERPHRRSFLSEMPDNFVPLEAKVLERYISNDEGSTKKVPIKNTSPSKVLKAIDIISKIGRKVVKKKDIEGGVCYVLDRCPWNDSHRDHGAYVIEYTNGTVIARCHHDSCHHETLHSLIRKYELTKYEKEIGKVDTKDKSNDAVLLELVRLYKDEFYYDEQGKTYVYIDDEYLIGLYQINDKRYLNRLAHLFYKCVGRYLSNDGCRNFTQTLEAEAFFNGKKIETSLRCKRIEDKIYYHLADNNNTVVAISESGYEVSHYPSMNFLNRNSMKEQVSPKKGDVDFCSLARKYWTFSSREHELLHHVTLITRFISDIDSPMLYYLGDRGSAKTTSMQFDKLIVDPSIADVKTLSKSVAEIVTCLADEYMVCFDNLEGGISPDMANLFCQCVTGGTYQKRKLYTDTEQVSVQLKARLSFTSITTISNRPDFLDRTIGLNMKRIDDSKRRLKNEIISEFSSDLPYFLDAIFNILAKAMAIFPTISLKELPRMADYAKWGYCIAEVMGIGGKKFLAIYKKNQSELLEMMVEEDIVIQVIIAYLQEVGEFRGTMTELMLELNEYAKEEGIGQGYGCLKNPQQLSGKLNRNSSVFSLFGICFERKKSNGQRIVHIYINDEEE